LIEKFALEARQVIKFAKYFITNSEYILIYLMLLFMIIKSRVEFVRALKDYSSGEPSLLGFRKGDIIRILKNKNLHLAKGNHLSLF
jgi:hypothetical protein